MKVLLHKSRHVVVAPDLDQSDPLSEDVAVVWVGVSPAVSGVSRRGRPPSYSKPIPSAELTDFDMADADEKLRQKLSSMTASADSQDETSGDDDSSVEAGEVVAED
jgi:hypothetical protein